MSPVRTRSLNRNGSGGSWDDGAGTASPGASLGSAPERQRVGSNFGSLTGVARGTGMWANLSSSEIAPSEGNFRSEGVSGSGGGGSGSGMSGTGIASDSLGSVPPYQRAGSAESWRSWGAAGSPSLPPSTVSLTKRALEAVGSNSLPNSATPLGGGCGGNSNSSGGSGSGGAALLGAIISGNSLGGGTGGSGGSFSASAHRGSVPAVISLKRKNSEVFEAEIPEDELDLLVGGREEGGPVGLELAATPRGRATSAYIRKGVDLADAASNASSLEDPAEHRLSFGDSPQFGPGSTLQSATMQGSGLRRGRKFSPESGGGGGSNSGSGGIGALESAVCSPKGLKTLLVALVLLLLADHLFLLPGRSSAGGAVASSPETDARLRENQLKLEELEQAIKSSRDKAGAAGGSAPPTASASAPPTGSPEPSPEMLASQAAALAAQSQGSKTSQQVAEVLSTVQEMFKRVQALEEEVKDNRAAAGRADASVLAEALEAARNTSLEAVFNHSFDVSAVHMSVMDNLERHGAGRWVFACDIDDGACRRMTQSQSLAALLARLKPDPRRKSGSPQDKLRVVQVGLCSGAGPLRLAAEAPLRERVGKYWIVATAAEVAAIAAADGGAPSDRGELCGGLQPESAASEVRDALKAARLALGAENVILDSRDPAQVADTFEQKYFDAVILDSDPTAPARNAGRAVDDVLEPWLARLRNDGLIVGHGYAARRVLGDNDSPRVDVSWLPPGARRLSLAELAAVKDQVDLFVARAKDKVGESILRLAGDTLWYMYKRKVSISDLFNAQGP
jgi:hypothetical protein